MQIAKDLATLQKIAGAAGLVTDAQKHMNEHTNVNNTIPFYTVSTVAQAMVAMTQIASDF